MGASIADTDLDCRCPKRVIGLFGLQMRDRQRRAAYVKRERYHRGGNPEPPRRLLLVEAGQGFAGATCAASASGTPSSATSLSLEYPPARRISSTSINSP